MADEVQAGAVSRRRSRRRDLLIVLGCALLVVLLPLGLGRVLRFDAVSPLGTVKPNLSTSQLGALGDDTVIISTQDGVHALRASDGKPRWHFPAQAGPGNTSYPAGALAVAGNVVYVVASVPNANSTSQPVGALVALRVSDGHALWTRPLALASYGEALTLSDGVLYLCPATVHIGGGYKDITASLASTQAGDHTAYAVRASDGTLLWQVTTPQVLNAIPYAANGMVYLATSDAVMAVRATDGSQVWSTPTGPGSAHPEGQRTAYVNGVSFTLVGTTLVTILESVREVSANGKNVQSTTSQLIGFDAQTGANGGFRGSSVADAAPPIAFPVPVGSDALYQEGAGITSMPLADIGGMPLGWFAGLGLPQVGVTYANGVLYSTDYGVQPWQGASVTLTHAVRASDGKELWRAATGKGYSAQMPTAGGGLVYAVSGTGDAVMALDARSGNTVWRYTVPGNWLIRASPAFVAGA